MSEVDVLPELKEIVGAMLFAAKHPVTAAQIRRVLAQVAETRGGIARDYAKAKEKDIRAAVAELKAELAKSKVGLTVSEVASGCRLENDGKCGMWVRELLQKGKPNRLSRPALETLAIIAYRQPCVRSEIEAVRGVAVDSILRNLLEIQLVRIVGRSELPGRPMLYGTTQKFLEHFGINNLNDLPGVEELKRMELASSKKDDAEDADEEQEELFAKDPEEVEESEEGDVPSEEEGEKES